MRELSGSLARPKGWDNITNVYESSSNVKLGASLQFNL